MFKLGDEVTIKHTGHFTWYNQIGILTREYLGNGYWKPGECYFVKFTDKNGEKREEVIHHTNLELIESYKQESIICLLS